MENGKFLSGNGMIKVEHYERREHTLKAFWGNPNIN